MVSLCPTKSLPRRWIVVAAAENDVRLGPGDRSADISVDQKIVFSQSLPRFCSLDGVGGAFYAARDALLRRIANESDRFRIARAEKKKDSRVVGNLKIAFYGKVTQNGN